MLLANRGVLVIHRTPQMVIMLGGVVEEAAQAGLNAERLGGLGELPESMKAAALQRSSSFEAPGDAPRVRAGDRSAPRTA